VVVQHNGAMGTVVKPITFEESLLLPEDRCEEIIEGVPRHMPPASDEHADTIERVYVAFSSRLDRRLWKVAAFGSGQLIRRDPLTYRVPDVAIYRRQELRTHHYVLATPELIVEIVSPANRKGNLQELLRHYASIGVPEVWFVYLDRREVRRPRLEGGEYREIECLSDGDIGVLGVTVRLGEIWGE
jgi:Uma2 family endonuclease